jgi:L-threonylcarbamoyladenylate synthase
MPNLSVSEAASRIRSGGLVAFPTETVYGLGANALDAAAVAKIYELKGRPATSPLIVHISSIEMAREVVAEWPRLADELAKKYWPGPLTLVLPKKPVVPDIVTAGLGTVGVRMPKHPIALELIEKAGVPIAAPSANRFSELSPTTAEHVRAAFGESVGVLDGGPSQVGIESTVVAIENGAMKLLRPGMISLGEIESTVAPEAAGHPAPGMQPKHYSPRTGLLLVDGPKELPGRGGAYVWYEKPGLAARTVRMPAAPGEYATRLYAVLHELDQERLPWIGIELPPDTLEWAAIRDRLRRAATPNN